MTLAAAGVGLLDLDFFALLLHLDRLASLTRCDLDVSQSSEHFPGKGFVLGQSARIGFCSVGQKHRDADPGSVYDQLRLRR